jgi:hypothetical protein
LSPPPSTYLLRSKDGSNTCRVGQGFEERPGVYVERAERKHFDRFDRQILQVQGYIPPTGLSKPGIEC